jgi:hypothetical protein
MASSGDVASCLLPFAKRVTHFHNATGTGNSVCLATVFLSLRTWHSFNLRILLHCLSNLDQGMPRRLFKVCCVRMRTVRKTILLQCSGVPGTGGGVHCTQQYAQCFA